MRDGCIARCHGESVTNHLKKSTRDCWRRLLACYRPPLSAAYVCIQLGHPLFPIPGPLQHFDFAIPARVSEYPAAPSAQALVDKSTGQQTVTQAPALPGYIVRLAGCEDPRRPVVGELTEAGVAHA